MTRTERVIVVFVASPSDLEAERNRIEEVIRELNVTWSRTLGVRLDLVRWETHGYPGMGDDAQEVLNRELPDDYDIFVGLMWSNYGTPTGRAGSGTEEEFNRAVQRVRRGEAVKVMFYFKDAPLSPSAIDPGQLASIQRFKSGLGTEGSLYWTFITLDDFERLIRLHLARQIQEFVASDQQSQLSSVPRHAEPQTDTGNELGLLDALDLAEEHFVALNEITKRITDETTCLGTQMQQRSSEINVATEAARGQLSRRDARGLVERGAADMDHYVARVRTELPLFREHLQKGADAIAHAALMTVDFWSKDRTQAVDARTTLISWRDAVAGAYDSVLHFRDSIQHLPRITAVLNRAKRETVSVLDEVLESLAMGRRLVAEAIGALDVLLGNESGNA